MQPPSSHRKPDCLFNHIMMDLNEKVSDAVPFGPSVVSLVLLLAFYHLLCSRQIAPMTAATLHSFLTPQSAHCPSFPPGSHCILGAALTDSATASNRRVVCPMYGTCLDLLQKLFWAGIVSSVSSYSNALLLGWSCSWWMDFYVLEWLASVCKEQNRCFQKQTLCAWSCVMQLVHRRPAALHCCDGKHVYAPTWELSRESAQLGFLGGCPRCCVHSELQRFHC